MNRWINQSLKPLFSFKTEFWPGIFDFKVSIPGFQDIVVVVVVAGALDEDDIIGAVDDRTETFASAEKRKGILQDFSEKKS